MVYPKKQDTGGSVKMSDIKIAEAMLVFCEEQAMPRGPYERNPHERHWWDRWEAWNDRLNKLKEQNHV